MPDLAGATGGETMDSEAAMPCESEPLAEVGVGAGEVCIVVGDLEVSDSGTMVDWDEEREKVLARGARCVSLSSREREGQ